MAKQPRIDKELERYRSLMEVPDTFEDGFSWMSLAGAIFIALLMVPGAMYMQLLAGIGVGPAAQWVTVILFIEVARRAHKNLKRSEIFVLFYMAGALMAAGGIGFGPVRLLYMQFFAQSKAATGSGIVDTLPYWVAPTDPDVLAERNFFNPIWLPALGLLVFQTVFGQINTKVLSYGLFRLASDIEKLPFPMAPIGAQGIMALAEQQSEEGKTADVKEGWRWRVFSIGAVLGLAFGAIYLALPAISGAVFGRPITLLPIPFSDWTPKTGNYLPAFATGWSWNIQNFIVGMVLPFFAMLGAFIGLLVTMVANPLLRETGILSSWEPGMGTIDTLYLNNVDFYLSFSIGVSIAIAVAGIISVIRHILANRRRVAEQRRTGGDSDEDIYGVPPGRGDIRTPWIIGVYLVSTSLYIIVSGFLVNWHGGVMLALLFFGFLYTPMISYVTARLEGMAGQVVEIPMVRELAFILSGYSGGVAIWFLPIPLANYGVATVFYRQAELTGTRFWSIWKATIFLVPLVLVASILFAQFIWSLAPIPGPQYPFADKMWELQAANQSIIFSSTLGRFSTFERAFEPAYLAAGASFGLVLFGALALLHVPTMLMYGMVRGLNQTLPHAVLPQFIGACVGRFYFEKRMGLKWRQYIPVVAAGFTCGMGLITVLAVGIVFLSKSVIKIPY